MTANALSASATIFEAVSDVDAKFAKLTDKECDGISAEVKKWFKKLAVSTHTGHHSRSSHPLTARHAQKEERAHDDRVANANYKIKQAGQVYERNVKKNPQDAAEEHNRYIQLLSTLGPEITAEKQSVVRARVANVVLTFGIDVQEPCRDGLAEACEHDVQCRGVPLPRRRRRMASRLGGC